MDMSTAAVAQAALPAAAQAGGRQAAADTPAVSFAQVLGGMNGSPAAGNGMGWREMRAVLGQAVTGAGQAGELAELPAELTLDSLMKMLAEILGGGASPVLGEEDLASGQDLGAAIQKRLKQWMEENGGSMAAQQWLGALFPDYSALPSAQGEVPVLSGQADAQQALQSVLAAEPSDVLPLLAGLSSETLGALVQALGRQPQQAEPWQAQPEQPAQPHRTQAPDLAQAAGGADRGAQGGETPGQPLDGAAGNAELLQTTRTGVLKDPEAAFQDSVRAAKQQMQESAKPAAKPVDADTLQQQVDAGVYLRGTALAQTAAVNLPPEQPLPLASQVQQGVLTALRDGAEQFSIKLMPEGLGELTLKLTKTGDGMTLSLVAKSAETQRLLSEELGSLRDSLRPLRVEVDSVLTQRQADLLSQQQSFEQQGRQGDWRTFKGAAYYKDEPLGEGGETQAAQPVQPEVLAQARQGAAVLDAYI